MNFAKINMQISFLFFMYGEPNSNLNLLKNVQKLNIFFSTESQERH